MRHWARRLTEIGEVVSFDYLYMREGRRRPDRLPALITAHRAELAHARERHPGPVVLAGKSMGSRIGCHVALADSVSALVCLGYPLVGATGAVRDEVLLGLSTPILFVQGTRDRLCPLERLEGVRARMRAPSVLYVVDGSDHSLLVGKTQLRERGLSQEAVDDGILDAIRSFAGEHAR
jgi:predicted alpha/beta-hydrolase family hydrolase